MNSYPYEFVTPNLGDYSKLSLTSRKHGRRFRLQRPFGGKSLELPEAAKTPNVLPRIQMNSVYTIILYGGSCCWEGRQADDRIMQKLCPGSSGQ